MEQTPVPPRLSPADDRRATAKAFGRWLRDRMIDRDYADRGGQAKLAAETTLAPATISRFLRGEILTPDIDSLRRIATALRLPFPDVLVHAGVLTPDDLSAYQSAPASDRPPLTTEQAAAERGIIDPVALEIFEAGVDAARTLQAKRLKKRRAG